MVILCGETFVFAHKKSHLSAKNKAKNGLIILRVLIVRVIIIANFNTTIYRGRICLIKWPMIGDALR